jgi:23S rRNA pseudouridine1911/1915/1917 synthase
MTQSSSTLRAHLAALGHSNSEQRALLSSGKVFLHGVPTADAGRLVDPAAVEVRPRAPKLIVGKDPVLLWRDAALAVIWKPPGLLSVPAPRRHEHNALGFVRSLLGAALPVHRLDEGTSGLLCVALTEPAQLALKDLLERHDVERSYLAIVSGQPSWSTRTVDLPLTRDRGDGLRGVWDPPPARPGQPAPEPPPDDLRPARTDLRRLELLDHAALVEARLHTGRTHQVRLHLDHLGHTLLGDPLYANQRVAARAPRLALHAATLGFAHPLTGVALRFEAPLPDDLEQLRRALSLREGGRPDHHRPERGEPRTGRPPAAGEGRRPTPDRGPRRR